MGDETDLKSYLDTLQEQRPRYGDFLAHLEHKARKMNVPLFGQFELTPLCTLDCRMCYIHLTPEQMDGPLLTVAQWKDIFDQALAAGMLEATLTGRERR